MRSRIIWLFVALSLLAGLTPGKLENKEYLSTFETVWETVNETFYDPTFGGLNWKDVYNRYQPMIAAAEKDDEFYGLINRMLWELKVSHANMVPPGSLALYEPLVFAEGSPGLDIRLLNGAVVVTSVKPGSPANTAGIRPGFVIQAIEGIPVEQIVQEAERVNPPPSNSRSRVARSTKWILGRLYGASGTEVSIAFSDETGKKSEKKIGRAKRTGVALGPIFLAIDFEARRLDNGIGYIRLNTFQPQLAPQISKAIKAMGNVRGIILDLRGNSGGEIEGMPELFLADRTLLYLNRARSGETKVFFDPGADAFRGPLVLLVDPLSGSASELFAAGMKAIGRAAVVGERSPGSVMEMDRKIFPNGAILMYPVAQIVTPDGTVLEGRGVVPDIEVGLGREMLLKGIDSQLDSAVKYIEKGVSQARK